jgi:hypothetical protein
MSAMPTIVRRAVAPLLLIVAGVVAMIYGAAFHEVTVLEDREREKTEMVLEPSAPEPSPFPGMDPNGMQFAPPKLKKKTTKYKTVEPTVATEPELVRYATIDGIILTDKHELKLRYSPGSGEKPPALCPT